MGQERERTSIGCLWYTSQPGPHPNLGWNPHLRHVPWPGIEPATFHFGRQRPTSWVTLVRAALYSFLLPNDTPFYGFTTFCLSFLSWVETTRGLYAHFGYWEKCCYERFCISFCVDVIFQFSLTYLGEELLGRIVAVFNCLRNCHCFSQQLHHFLFPSAMLEFQFLHVLASTF